MYGFICQYTACKEDWTLTILDRDTLNPLSDNIHYSGNFGQL